ncbi:MAG: bifunctional 2-polyprenyl-6-hydroxyphenol methylase/3-demethylubiquinol 3-O-methyltransferase UbiG [Alphaproteobacteria bacterium]|nr:bifunctional 2-polyprenyl-6-hydroxyphenol methylase/3-demethylubiquinol 3-O-methyltransferase UbiG [Alphaproteobacteria bacterium]
MTALPRRKLGRRAGRRRRPVAAPRRPLTVDAGEVANFAAMARAWWDPGGEFRPLHQLNPVRLTFLRDQLARHFGRDPTSTRPFKGLSLLDIGCGGGIVAEPMARLGFTVTGIDADATAIRIARAHAADAGLTIDYRQAAAEDLIRRRQRFDAVLALEVIEHSTDPAVFVATAAALVAPGGGFALSTLNRTLRSFLFAIVGAEYVLRWVPRGTHRWSKFVRPSEVAEMLRKNRLDVATITALNYRPDGSGWLLGGRPDVNYLLFASKLAGK